jgi:beta-xylosidase
MMAAYLVCSYLASLANSLPSAALQPRQRSTFANPIAWEDKPDSDVFRVGDVFYYSSSSFAYSPGAPLFKSYDLANWTPAMHSVPRLDFGEKYNLDNATDRAYVNGIWTSTVRYRESSDTFYWIGCVDFTTYIYTSPGGGAKDNNGKVGSWDWQQAATIDTCYDDYGLLIDDHETMYVAYGDIEIHVAQLSSDGLGKVTSQQVYSGGSTYIEGSHMYKINGYYWIVPTKAATGE